MRILIAETDAAFLRKMRDALNEAGYHVTVADNGMTAWQQITEAEPPGLLITRFSLGPGNPPGTALGLYAHSCHPKIPVVYIPADAERAQHADQDHGRVLIKPFALSDLVDVVNQLLKAEPDKATN